MGNYLEPLNRQFEERLKKEPRQRIKFFPFFASLVLSLLILSLIPSKTLLTANKNLLGGQLILVKNNDFKILFEQARAGRDINILTLGISGGDHISPNLTDSIMVLKINPYKQKSFVISIPRDLYVKTPGGDFAKINSLYQNYGLTVMLEKIKEITELDIDLYSVIDLTGLEKIIDKVGGLYLPASSGPKRGEPYPYPSANRLTYFDSQGVLNYIRLRPDSDFGRIKRQQLVINSLKDKLIALNPFFDFYKIYEMMKILKTNLLTNLSVSDLKTIFTALKSNDIKTEYLTIDTANFLEAKMADTEIGRQYVLLPKLGTEDYGEIKTYLQLHNL